MSDKPEGVSAETVKSTARAMYYSWWVNEAEESFEESSESGIFERVTKAAITALLASGEVIMRSEHAAKMGKVRELVNAASAVLKYREGKLPTGGWLRDHDVSRAELENLSVALSTFTTNGDTNER